MCMVWYDVGVVWYSVGVVWYSVGVVWYSVGVVWVWYGTICILDIWYIWSTRKIWVGIRGEGWDMK